MSSHVTNNGITTLSPLTLTSNGAAGSAGILAQTISLSDFGINHITQPHIKKYEIYEFDEDILAISVAWKRLREKGVSPASRITDYAIRKHVTHEDKEKANEIADYYSKKIMMLTLKGKTNMSMYRKDLTSFVTGDRMKITDKFFGLAYHLPSFYEYDVQLDYVKSTVKTNQDWKNNSSKYHAKINQLTVSPVKKFRRKTKSVDTMNYWFKTDNDIGLLIPVSNNNSLSHMWDYIYNNSTTLVLEGNTHCKELDGFEYLMLGNWHIAKT